MPDPRLLDSLPSLRTWRADASGTIGFVPTMGALHEGHATLLRRLRPRCDRLVLSIFVNPTQFGPNEDLAKYPRTLERDLGIARREGVDAVYVPPVEAMYPHGFSTCVEERSLTAGLCGRFRPGHFGGVTTVVLKLFNQVRPRVAYFGLKDAQQFFVLRKMASDLDLEVSVEGVATVREPGGLALSSRNAYLSPSDRERAPRLYRSLRDAADRLSGPASEGSSATETIERARREMAASGFDVQYLELLELPGLARPRDAERIDAGKPYLLAVAAFLGGTRLIDNVILRPESLRALGVELHLE